MEETHSNVAIAESPPIIKVFWSYAPENRKLRDELEQHLSALKYEGHISMWHDREILPGVPWEREVEACLNAADLVLPLVSVNFLSSAYCWGKEMQYALERWKRGEIAIVPILASPVDCQGTPISHLEMLPTGKKAITDWSDRQKACVDVAMGIRKIVNVLLARKWKLRGDAYSSLQQYSLALAAYEEALRLDPRNSILLTVKGGALFGLKRLEEAIVVYNQAIQIDPNYGFAYKGKGDALDAFAPLALEKYKRLAQQSYQQAIRLESTKKEQQGGKQQ